jgi:hypothetical protein
MQGRSTSQVAPVAEQTAGPLAWHGLACICHVGLLSGAAEVLSRSVSRLTRGKANPEHKTRSEPARFDGYPPSGVHHPKDVRSDHAILKS